MAVRPSTTVVTRSLRAFTPSLSTSTAATIPLVSQHGHTLLPPSTSLLHSSRSPSQKRHSSHGPSSPASLSPSQKPVTIQTLQKLYAQKTPITMLTAHDHPSALLAQSAGTDMLLVGDSLAMVALGMPDTSEVTLDEMLVFSRAVSRASNRCFVVGDLPMGSYEVSTEQAVASAVRMVKEGRVQAVKLEGGEEMADRVRGIVRAGISVVGHVGLTPQRQHSLGGFRVQGNSVGKADKLWRDAKAVRDAGAFMVVLEAVPGDVAEVITERLGVPTIGIGAGKGCSGQVLVQVDMLGWRPKESFLPKFVKRYGDVWGEGLRGISEYVKEVREGSYPSQEFEYKRDPSVAQALHEKLLREDAEAAE